MIWEISLIQPMYWTHETMHLQIHSQAVMSFTGGEKILMVKLLGIIIDGMWILPGLLQRRSQVYFTFQFLPILMYLVLKWLQWIMKVLLIP